MPRTSHVLSRSRPRTRPRLVALLATASMASLAAPADAGDRLPVSALPTAPPFVEVKDPATVGAPAGVSVKEEGTDYKYHVLEAATRAGYCVVSRTQSLRMQATTDWDFEDADEVWRFTEDSGPSVERTRFARVTEDRTLRVRSRQTIRPVEVARANGLTVWGFRESNGDVVLLARGAQSGREGEGPWKEPTELISFAHSDCTFGATRIAGQRAKTGAVAQLRGELPPVGEGESRVVPRFIVDATLAKLSRDPEPILSVRIRSER